MDFIRFQTTGTVGRSVATIVIPEGMEGKLCFQFKTGHDAFLLAYADGKRDQSGDSPWIAIEKSIPIPRLYPGIWKFWAFNESRGWFEDIVTKFIPSTRAVGTIRLKTTPRNISRGVSRISYEIRLVVPDESSHDRNRQGL